MIPAITTHELKNNTERKISIRTPNMIITVKKINSRQKVIECRRMTEMAEMTKSREHGCEHAAATSRLTTGLVVASFIREKGNDE